MFEFVTTYSAIYSLLLWKENYFEIKKRGRVNQKPKMKV